MPRIHRTAATLLGLGLLLAPAGGDAADPVNKVVLRINGRIVTLYDYEQRKADTEREVSGRPDLPLARRREVLNRLGEMVYRDLFEETLLLSRADQADVVADPAEIEESIGRMRESAGLADDQQFETALAQSGLSRVGLRDQVERTLRIQTLLSREVQNRIEVDEEVLRRYYRDHPEEFTTTPQVWLRELVVLEDSGLGTEERLRLAETIRQAALAGKPLSELAAEHSPKLSTSSLIDLGWVSPGDLAPELAQAVASLAAGEVTPPVAARGGFHILEVVERRDSAVRPYPEVADAIRARERQRRFGDEYQKYLAELEKQAFIVTSPPAEAADFRRTLGNPDFGASATAQAAAEVAAEKVAAEAEIAPAADAVSQPPTADDSVPGAPPPPDPLPE